MREPQILSFWIGGMQSLLHPADIPKNQYAWGENIVNRGGMIQTRPGFKLRASIAGRNPQGLCVFKPTNSTRKLVAAVDGSVYVASWPRLEFVKLDGVQFSASAPRVHFCETLRSAKLNEDGTVERIEPTSVLVMQDGESAAAFWDGSTARHCNPEAPHYETPSGTWMCWSSSRLWIIKGSKVIASDLADPLAYLDNTILADGRGGFQLPADGTGIAELAQNKGVIAFTANTATTFKSFIHDRTTWGKVEEFQVTLLPAIGCAAGRAIVNQFGALEWLSPHGWISLDAALNTLHSSKLLTSDEEMMRSKRNLSPVLENACAAAFSNTLLVSVPSGSKWNAHTWMRDQAVLGSPLGSPPAVWASVWTGPRPVQWASGNLGGRERLYFLSYDKTALNDTRIHVGEAFQEDRTDGGGPITWQFVTGTIAASKLMRFKFAEIEAIEILGEVSLQVYVCGTKGGPILIGDFSLQAEIGSIGSSVQRTIRSDSILRAFKPQARTLKTNEFTLPKGEACHPERSGSTAGIDKGFFLIVVGTGRCGIREIKLTFDTETPDPQIGKCARDESNDHNAVSERGERITQ